MESLPIDQIEQYLLDQLPQEERMAFEVGLEQNPAWAEQVAEHKTLMAGIQLHGQRKLKNRFSQLEKSLTSEEKTLETKVLPFYRRHALLIAAGFALLIVGAWIIFSAKSTDPLADIDPIALHYESGIGTRGEADSCAKVIQAVSPYNNRDYTSAVTTLQQLLDTSLPPNCPITASEIQLLLGVSQFQLGDFPAAEKTFSNVCQLQDKQEAASRWYLALTYGKRKQLDKMELELKRLVEETGGYYGNKAAQVLDRL